MKKVLAFVFALVLLAGTALAGTVSPGLERQMRTMNAGDEIKVLVVMTDQVDIRTLDWQLHDAKTAMDTRHRVVLEELQTMAASSQRGLLAELSDKALTGEVRGYTPHWIVNGVVVVTTVEHVKALAERDDVEVIEADLLVELIEPIKDSKPAAADKAIGIAPGIVDIGARRIWNELGVDGTGALVGVLDTGVDGAHPALSTRWRGNHAPASECWLDAANLGDATPVDQHYHGTHVMGTITGLAAGDTIGAAPGAEWIASNVINMGSGTAFDNAVIASLEFMADPDGDPMTTDDVPDVVQNSWGVNEGFAGYVDCDSRWWTAIDACEAAGVVLTWSAGNEGPGGTTMRSPADRATTAYNCFSVGSTNHTAPYVVSSFSSRGPSGCGGAFAVKPEIMAPGDNIYSAQPGGGYQLLSGTSMAGPHVAGIVALMRAANPGIDVITIKQTIINTALDLGAAGEENTNGHGFIDGYACVLAVMSGFGTLEGTVTDIATALPLAGVTLAISSPGETTRNVVTNATGFYSSMLPEAVWSLDATAFGYVAGNVGGISVIADATTVQNMSLTLAPHSVVSGTVLLPDLSPATAATVTAVGTPLAPVATDGAGFYSISLPTGDTYELLARQNGFAGHRQNVAVTGNQTVDFQLAEMTHEDFESGDFSNYPWVMSGSQPWTIDMANSYEGIYSARSGVILDGQSSTMTVDLDLNAGPFSFWYKVSSESGYDFLTFSVDGVQVASWSGTVAWTQYITVLTSGTHSLAWTYAKDGSVASGSDAAWVDYIGEPIYATIAVNPASLSETLAPGQTSQQTVTVSNDGLANLNFTSAALLTPPPLAATALEMGKDDIDPRPGYGPLLANGGPDAFGYTWIDSDNVGGPVFDWAEINAVGTPRTFGDDQSQSFPLGFSFSFYGVDYTNVNVCSNGFLSFTSTVTDYTNDPIPTASDPNALMAVFWDDMNPGSSGQIYTYQDTANNRFIVEWEGVPYYNTTQYQTFQAVINSDGTFRFQYLTIDDRLSATVGIENSDGTDGLGISHNSAYAQNGLAVEFGFTPPPAPWMTLDTAAGSVLPGGSMDLTVTFDSTDTPDGVYEGYLLIDSDDPNTPQVVVPVTLTVATGTAAGDGMPNRYALGDASPNPFNPSTKISFAVPTGGSQVSLAIFDLQGRHVKTLVSGSLNGGQHSVTWNGDDTDGRRVASGLYFYRLAGKNFSETRKMALVK